MATTRPTPTPEYSTYPLEKLRTLWGRAELTPEQMIGHLVQHLLDQDTRLRRLEHPSIDPPRPAEGAPRK